jgi:hypothetical protein
MKKLLLLPLFLSGCTQNIPVTLKAIKIGQEKCGDIPLAQIAYERHICIGRSKFCSARDNYYKATCSDNSTIIFFGERIDYAADKE